MSRRIRSTDRASSPRYCVAVYPPGRYPLPSSHGPDSSPESRTANTAEATHPRPRPASLATAAAGRAETERKKANDGSSRAAHIVPSVNVMVILRALPPGGLSARPSSHGFLRSRSFPWSSRSSLGSRMADPSSVTQATGTEHAPVWTRDRPDASHWIPHGRPGR